MSYEQHIDTLATLAADQDPISILESPEEIEETKRTVNALETGADALAFCQSLWELLTNHGMITESNEPDLHKMEKIIDLLYAELGAVTLVFSDPAFSGMPTFFDKLADSFSQKKDLPPELARGARRFSARLSNTKRLDQLNITGITE